MYARVINGVVLSGKMDELISVVNDDLAPRMRRQPGSQGMLLLTDIGTGRSISISLWDSKEAMMEGEANDFLADQLSQLLPLLEDAPSTRNFRVSVSL